MNIQTRRKPLFKSPLSLAWFCVWAICTFFLPVQSQALIRNTHILHLCVDVDETTIGREDPLITTCHGRASQHFWLDWLSESEKVRIGIDASAPAAIFRLGKTDWCLAPSSQIPISERSNVGYIEITKNGCAKGLANQNVWYGPSFGGHRRRITLPTAWGDHCLSLNGNGLGNHRLRTHWCVNEVLLFKSPRRGTGSLNEHLEQFWWVEQ